METKSSSPPYSYAYQQETNPVKEVVSKSNQGFVPLVLGPILKCMGFVGLPVPDDCPHVKTGSTADTSTCSSCSSVQNQDSLRHVHTEDTLLQDLDTPPQDCREDALISDHPGASLHHSLHDSQTGGATDQNLVSVPNLKDSSENGFNQSSQQRTNGHFQTVIKRNELKGKQTVYPIMQTNDKKMLVSTGGTNTPVKLKKHVEDVEEACEPKEQKQMMEKRLCPACRRKKTVRNVVFAFIVMISVANVGRYATVFFNVSAVDSRLVSSITNMNFILWSIFIYITSYPTLYTHLPRLLQLLQFYDDSYSVRMDCHALRRKVIYLLLWSFVFQVCLTSSIIAGMHTFLPSLRYALSPFHDLEGPALYVVSCVLGLVSYLLMGPFIILISLLIIGTYFLVKEYRYVTQQLALLLTSREDSLLNEPQLQVSNRRSDSEQSETGIHAANTGYHSYVVKGNGEISDDDFQSMAEQGISPPSSLAHRHPQHHQKKTGISSSSHTDSTKSKSSSQKTVSKNSTEKKRPQLVRIVMNRNKISSPPPAFVYQPPRQKGVQTRVESGIKPKPSYSTNNIKKDTEFPIKQRFPDQMIQFEDIEETINNIEDNMKKDKTSHRDDKRQLRVLTDNSDINPSEHHTRHRQQHPGQRKDMEDVLHQVQGHHHGKERREEREESRLQDVEDVFDHLCGQHQVLCAILRRIQGCLSHIISMPFTCGIPVFCVMIYGLGSSSVKRDEAGLLGFVLSETVMSIVTTTVLGIVLNDHAHGAQEVMYAADWSQFSDRLLTKMHLFASRLGHCQIGYDVYGLFVIDRSTVLMVAGTLVTYTVVVIQFQQSTSHATNSTSALS